MQKPLSFFGALALIASFPIAAQDPPPSSTDVWAMPDRELMLPVEGGKIWVRINGDLNAEALPAIFIHGGPGGTHATFGEMLPLADKRAVILYDQLDSGMSERPNDPANWRVERFVSELEAIRQSLGIERWHLVGHSWGSAVALEYAAAYPMRVASTVLGGTFISTTHWITDANLLLRAVPDETRALVRACESDDPPSSEDCEAAYTRVYSEFYAPAPRSAAAREYYANYGGLGLNSQIYNGMWGPSEFASSGSLMGYDATLKLRDLDGSRTLFMIGQYDSARIDTVQEFVALTPGSELAVVPGGGHGFIKDRPIESVAILRSWLARKDPTK